MSEIFDIFDENNNPTGKTATRDECHDPDKRLIHRDIHILIRGEDNKIYSKGTNKLSRVPFHIDQGMFVFDDVCSFISCLDYT